MELVEALRYKLRMFGIPMEGPTNTFCDNETVTKNTILPESTLKKKQNSIIVRERQLQLAQSE